MNDLFITVLDNRQFLKANCCLCSARFALDDPQPSITDADGDRHAVSEKGDVCPECFDTLTLHNQHVLADDIERDIQEWAKQQQSQIADEVQRVKATATRLRAANIVINDGRSYTRNCDA